MLLQECELYLQHLVSIQSTLGKWTSLSSLGEFDMQEQNFNAKVTKEHLRAAI